MAAGSIVSSSDFRVGVVARGRRTTSTGTFTTTETGVLRIDNIPVVSGLLYLVTVGVLVATRRRPGGRGRN